MQATDNDYLSVLGHVIGLNAEGGWSCSCGFSGTVEAMGNHLAQDISAQIDARLKEAKHHGLIPLRG